MRNPFKPEPGDEHKHLGQTVVGKIPASVVGRESAQATELRMMIQGLAQLLTSISSRDDAGTMQMLEEVARGEKAISIGTGPDPENAILFSLSVTGDPFGGLEALANARIMEGTEAEVEAKLAEMRASGALDETLRELAPEDVGVDTQTALPDWMRRVDWPTID